ncbi:hypothetical protein C8R47DRAFT_1081544 [Mycena vitilis]|nr:hypothetical protein C8R47DRAFT_1081544 [Mycena vitilis]
MVAPFVSATAALILLAFRTTPGCAVPTNITVDDTNSTVWSFIGTSSSAWHAVTPSTPCSGCNSKPDATKMFNSSWHDGTDIAGSVTFQGTAIYIYGVDMQSTAGTNISFSMNDPPTASFHLYGSSATSYNVSFFSATNLDPNVQHTVSFIGQTTAVNTGAMVFDYAVITVDVQPAATSSSLSDRPSPSVTPTPTPKHKSKTGVIIGPVVGVVAALALLVGVVMFLRRRRPRPTTSTPSNFDIDPDDSAAARTRIPAPTPELVVEPYEPEPYQPMSVDSLREPSFRGEAVSVSGVSTVSLPAISPVSSPPPATANTSTVQSDTKSPPAPIVLSWDPNAQTSDIEARLSELEALVRDRPPQTAQGTKGTDLSQTSECRLYVRYKRQSYVSRNFWSEGMGPRPHDDLVKIQADFPPRLEASSQDKYPKDLLRVSGPQSPLFMLHGVDPVLVVWHRRNVHARRTVDARQEVCMGRKLFFIAMKGKTAWMIRGVKIAGFGVEGVVLRTMTKCQQFHRAVKIELDPEGDINWGEIERSDEELGDAVPIFPVTGRLGLKHVKIRGPPFPYDTGSICHRQRSRNAPPSAVAMTRPRQWGDGPLKLVHYVELLLCPARSIPSVFAKLPGKGPIIPIARPPLRQNFLRMPFGNEGGLVLFLQRSIVTSWGSLVVTIAELRRSLRDKLAVINERLKYLPEPWMAELRKKVLRFIPRLRSVCFETGTTGVAQGFFCIFYLCIPPSRTTWVPTIVPDQELLEIQALLVEPSVRIIHLDDGIAELQKAIDKLAQERDGLGAFVKAHKALVSPVRRLPLDIIQEIFLACLPTHRNCAMSSKEPPVLLGRICSSWRAISLSTPRLWAKIHLVRPPRPPPEAGSHELQSFEKKLLRRLETFKDWLGRSGECTLAISLEEYRNYRPMPSDIALIPFASRWREIKLSTQARGALMETLSTLTSRDVPLLQGLTIHDRYDLMDPPSQKSWASAGILGGLALRRFWLSTSTLRHTELPVRWNQLASLSLGDLDWNSLNTLSTDRALQILSQCPVLTSCRLVLNDNDEDMGNDAVAFIVSPVSTLSRMFRRLSVHGLRKFVLRGFSAPETHNTLSFSSFLAAVTQLEILDISTDTFSKASLIELLRGLPTIQRLEVQHAWLPGVELPFDEDILDILTPSRDESSYCCPALRELVMRQCMTSVSDAALLRLIDARMRVDSCSSLTRVDVAFWRERQVDILPDLRQFQDRGFHVSLQYHSEQPSGFSPWLGLEEFASSWPQNQLLGDRPNIDYGF